MDQEIGETVEVPDKRKEKCDSISMVDSDLAKIEAVGSNPIYRSNFASGMVKISNNH